MRAGLLGGILLAAAETLLRYLPALDGTDLASSALLPVTAAVCAALPAGLLGLVHPAAGAAVVVLTGAAGGGVIGGLLGLVAAALSVVLSRSVRGTLVAGAVCLMAAVLLRAPPTQTCTAPVVVLVVMDTVGAGATSLHGAALPTTPGLQALAARGRWFSEAMAPAPWTLPSHAAMFTGQSPRTVGAHHERLALDDGAVTLAQRLSDAGWRTGAFVANPWVGRQTGLTRGFSHQEHHREISTAAGTLSALSLLPVSRSKGGRGLVKRALSWIGRCDGQPTFAFLNLLEAHSPFHQNADPGRFGVSDPQRVSQRMAAVQLRGPTGAAGFPEEGEVDAARRVYAAGVAEVDALIGTLADALPEAAMVVTADHGEAFGEHGFYGHMIGIHAEVLQVPLVVVGPGVEPEQIATPVSTMRVHDTVLDLAGMEAPDSLLGEVEAVPVISEQLRPVLKLGDMGAGAEPWMDSRQLRVQLGAEVLIRRVPTAGPVQWQRYDREHDPMELDDRWSVGEEGALRSVLSDVDRVPVIEGASIELDEGMRAGLHALGYIDGE